MSHFTQLTEVKNHFFKINRGLTLGLILMIVLFSIIFWYTGIFSLESSSVWIGLALMLLAIVFYQLPFLSYLLTKRYFKQQENISSELLNSNWSQFKNWLES